MLDIALLTANASQLRYILQVRQSYDIFGCKKIGSYVHQVGPDNHDFYTPMLIMVITSMSLQVAIFGFWRIKQSPYLTLKALNGLAQLIMGPLDIDKDEHKSFLNVAS